MSMEYKAEPIRDVMRDEIRDGYLVTTDRKKIWKKELQLLMEIDRICTKYGLKYYMEYGSLLGAIRHKGFIPWDDDIDITMMRPDYNKFIQVAQAELKKPYFLQSMYTGYRMFPFSKVMDLSTAAIEYPDDTQIEQGIFVDVFVMDDVPDGENEQLRIIDEMKKELWCAVCNPNDIVNRLANPGSLYCNENAMRKIMDLNIWDRFKQYEIFCEEQFGKSKNVRMLIECWVHNKPPYKREWFEETLWVPYEELMVPVPAGYDNILTAAYWDWQIPEKNHGVHGELRFSADIPYYELMAAKK